MKKRGFTLAEILITLGIIGVVAALTAPALVQSAGNAKIGPTLSKVKSTLEIANEKILTDESASSLYSLATADSSLYGKDNSAYFESMQNAMLKYCDYLSKYILGSSYKTTPVKYTDFNPLTKNYDGTQNNGLDGYILFHYSDNIDILFAQFKQQTVISKGSFKGKFNSIIVDINGIKTGPNAFGKDMFFFDIDNSGSVLPTGSKAYAWAYHNGSSNVTWESGSSDNGCNSTRVAKYAYGCAGSIFDNDLKVVYK